MPCLRPKGPTWLDKVKFIADYAVHGCETTLRVYLRTGAQADLNLVMNLAGISSTEAVYTLLRPKVGRTERHGRTKGKRNRAIGKGSRLGRALLHGEEALPDSANLIANNVQLITGWQRPVYSALGEYLFEVGGALIRQAYYITIVNVAVDFGYDWYSGIIMSPESDCARGRFHNIMSLPAEPSYPYRNMGYGSELLKPDGAHRDVDSIRLDKGKWCIIIDLGLQTNGFPQSAGQAFAKLMVGENLDQQCGQAWKIEIEPNGGGYNAKVARVVQGPDRIAIFTSLHFDNPATTVNVISTDVYGFRMDS